MDFYLNELSLHNQFTAFNDFSVSLENILAIRTLIKRYNKALYCYSSILNSEVYANTSLRHVLNNFNNDDRDKKILILSWLDKNGPFWDSNRRHSPNEYYTFNDDVVTDKTLAEVAFNNSINQISSTISFSPSHFQLSPLIIQLHRDDASIVYFRITNYWKIIEVEQLLQNSDAEIDSWDSMIDRIKRDYPSFQLLNSFSEGLRDEPFNSSIANRAFHLVSYLNDYKNSLNPDNSCSEKTNEIINKFFTGNKALFSDSSDTEKNDPVKKNRLTIEGNFYPMHGKIRHRAFRLHFSWPILKSQPIILAYLGQKLTK
jgi:hypothetical protein